MLNLPRGWSEVTVEAYAEMVELQDEAPGVYGFMTGVLSILSGEDEEDIGDRSAKEVRRLFESVGFLKRPTQSAPARTLKVGEDVLTYKGVNSITLGELIDLTEWNASEVNLSKMAALMYRKTKAGEWGETIVEPRVYNLEERARLIGEKSVAEVRGVLLDFRSFNEMIRQEYAPIFTQPESEEEEEADEMPDIRNNYREKLQKQKEEAAKKHGWLRLVHEMCGDDVTKSREVLNTSAIYILNIMAMKHDLK